MINKTDNLTGISTNATSENNKISSSMTYLPTAKEYSELSEAKKSVSQFNAQWSEPKYQCPVCGGNMRKNLMIVLCSYPPQYKYQCDKCGHIDYQYI